MRFVHSLLLPLSLAGTALSAAVSSRSSGSACSDLWDLAPSLLSNVTVYAAEDHPGGNFTATGEATSPAYSSNVSDLAPFCRFGAWIKTSNVSKVQFEVWLPKPEAWSGRFATVGNGGDAGGVNFPDMGIPLTKYNFAVASTDTGHHGISGNGTFAAGNAESQIDFGYRAVHLVTVYSKAIVKAYYGRGQAHSYWLGCSSGGKQGLKEVQEYPLDYDGVLAGAAAQYWDVLSGQIYRLAAYVETLNTTGYLTRADYDTIGNEVLRQCDLLDGVADGVLTDPRLCRPDLSRILCSNPSTNSSACISREQQTTMETIWAQWTSVKDGTFLYHGMEVGSEGPALALAVTGVPYQLAPDYFNYNVQRNTVIANFTVESEEAFEDLVWEAKRTNPGGIIASNPNISDFLSHGKLLTFAGFSDTIIPSRSSIQYHEEVTKALGFKDLSDSYRLFMIPGMGHCNSGSGAWNVGFNSQVPLSAGGGGQSSVFDAEHDMVLALIDWVENGTAPDVIVGAKYNNDDKNQGVKLERKHCPYPKQGVYIGGDTNSHESFECRYA